MAGVIPHAEAQERVDGTEDRLLGVVDALKYYDSGDGGFGFLRLFLGLFGSRLSFCFLLKSFDLGCVSSSLTFHSISRIL